MIGKLGMLRMIAARLWRRSEGLGRFTSASPLPTCRGRAPWDAPASIITVYDFDAVCAGEDLPAFAAGRDQIVRLKSQQRVLRLYRGNSTTR